MTASRPILAMLLLASTSLCAPKAFAADPATVASESALEHTVSAALDDWDLPAAATAADELEKIAPDSLDSIEARALVRFHQGRYKEAVKLLDTLSARGRHDEKNETVMLIRKTAAIAAKFVEKKGTHFVVRYAPGEDAILADWVLETLEAQRAALEQDLGYAPPEIVPVEIYPTGDEFSVVTTLTRKEIETTGTIALCKFNKLMVTSPGALSYGYPWRDTVAHEFTHYVLARMTGNKVPIWLHEGLAKYQEVRWRRPVGGEPTPTTDTVLAEGMAKNHWVALKDMHPSIAKLPTAFDATLAFAEVESLISYCHDTWGYDGIKTLLTGLRDDKPMDVALLGAFGVGLSGLESTWRAWLAQHPPKLEPDLEVLETALKDPKADPDKSGAAHKGLSDEASDHLRLGDLLAGEVRLDAAVVEYKKAKDAERAASTKSGHGPIFDYKIASTYIAGNKWNDAEKTLVPVLDVYPTYAPALKAEGRIALATGDAKRAREYLEKTLWQTPFEPEVYELLADACTKTGDKACSDRAHDKLATLEKLLANANGGAPAAQP